ncbi:hypothetical protein GOQ27_14335 [Clostridium sp. D2Q-11]|uniref:Uncharacterized protein n=1 Tax=Anaeromonas frigoriresistens TaxID=2683708 RepID=A0A942Z9Y0_9FIRM|nr:hypothetical protein [Anaeromonas frigoriresistens]MBS4539649.1 hypothetical protein [Anaeromonas frigoriresistens]
MSLTSMLKGKTDKDKQFQSILRNIVTPRPVFSTVSGNKPFSSEYKELAPYNLSKTYYSTIVGTGFDYLARFMIARKLKIKDSKVLAYNNLVAEYGLKVLEEMLEGRQYKILNKKYNKGIKLCKRFVYNKNIDFDKLLNFSGYLASLEVIRRSGLPPMNIQESLIEDISIEIINDLRRLCDIFQNKFINSGVINEDSNVIFNPRFGIGSLCCKGADADLFIDGTLYDFKCTKIRGYRWKDSAQIVGYYLLNNIDIRCGGKGMGIDEHGMEYRIEKLAFYKGRYGEIEIVDVKSLDKNKIEQGIEELRKLWNLTFI